MSQGWVSVGTSTLIPSPCATPHPLAGQGWPVTAVGWPVTAVGCQVTAAVWLVTAVGWPLALNRRRLAQTPGFPWGGARPPVRDVTRQKEQQSLPLRGCPALPTRPAMEVYLACHMVLIVDVHAHAPEPNLALVQVAAHSHSLRLGGGGGWGRRPRGAGAGSHPRLPTPSAAYLPRYPAPWVPGEVGTYPRGVGYLGG